MAAKIREIKTTDKEAFLKAEYDFFKAVFEFDYQYYYADMQKAAIPCQTCGVIYWENTTKRCDCDKPKPEIKDTNENE